MRAGVLKKQRGRTVGNFDNIRIPWRGWEIKEKLGEGGYGEVYKIERTQHGDEDCEALKIIRIPKNRQEYDSLIYSEGSEDKAKKLLSKHKDNIITEIEALTRLRGNDNVVKINGWSEEKQYDGYGWEIYIRMDALTPLKKHINGKKEQKLEEEEVIRLGIDICNALKQCEEENIVHRDIKPDNILVSPSGKYMLTDFGIAKTLVEETTMTAVGTGWYMAPEVARYTKANKTVDLYSLGLVMYELLNNNRLPFLKTEGIVGALDRNTAKQRRLDGEDLPEPANGSDELKRIVLKATMAKKANRYQSAQAMLRDLEKLSREMHETSSEKSGEHKKTEQEIEIEEKTQDKDSNKTDLSLKSTSIITNGFLKDLLKKNEEDVKHYKLAAEQGDAVAQYNLGNCYLYGEGVEKNYEEAVKWYRLAAEQGDAFAQNKLGVCYEKGTGVEQNYEEAAKWYALAAEQGYVDARNNLIGLNLITENNDIDILIKHAEQGGAFAQNDLGARYIIGYGVEQNYEEGIKWYKRAAKQGYDRSQYLLGGCYREGIGVEQNYEEAFKWYKLAAEQGYAKAQNNLGYFYNEGIGVEQNHEEAFKWYKLAAEQGVAPAQYSLGLCYFKGEGVNQNYEEAFKWFKLAAEQGYAEAQNNLGTYYAKGECVEQNYEEAAKWFKLAAEQGDAVAQYNLGDCYLYGEGVERNYEEAVKWYRLAAEQGDAFAQNKLGGCYEKGTGVRQNYEEAAKWYALAAEQGYANAQDNLERCYDKMGEIAYDSQDIDEQELTLNEEEEIDALKRRLKELTDNDINLKKIEKDIVEEDNLDEKIDKYYSLYKENEEFQKLLDTEYADLKENNADDEITYGNQIIEGQEFTPHEEEEIEALKMRLKELTDNDINLKEIEKDIVEEDTLDEKIDKYYSLYEKNDEFRKLLDKEYADLKDNNTEIEIEYDNQNIDDQEFTLHEEDENEALKRRLKDLTDSDSSIEDGEEVIAAEKKRERNATLAFFFILIIVVTTVFASYYTKPENDPELREAYENFKEVATENGWDVGKLSSTKKGTYAYAKAHKSLNAEDAWSFITIELYKNEKDYAAEIKSYKSVAEIRGNPNVYTETANIYGQNITAFKDRTIYKANVKSDEGREEVYNLLEALGIETSSETRETTEDTPVKEQYNLEDYLGIYSNGQSGVKIIKDYSDEASESSVLIFVGWAWDGKVSRDWKMYGTFDSETASINYNKSDLIEYLDSNYSESKYTDDYGSGRFICNEDGSIKWEDDKDGIGNGETYTRCEPHMDKDFVGVWKENETYCTLNEDGNYSYYRGVYPKKEENGKWAVVEVPYGDDTRVYVVLYNDARSAPDYDNGEYLLYNEQEDGLTYAEYNILYRSDE